jgi:hypothetical protein
MMFTDSKLKSVDVILQVHYCEYPQSTIICLSLQPLQDLRI